MVSACRPLAAQGNTSGLAAQSNGKTSIVSASPDKTLALSDRKVPLLSHGITLAEFAGMKPTVELESQLAKVDGFVQNSPVDGQAGTEKTEAWIGRTSSTLYVVFACHDDHPGLIRGHLARRENILSDDTVTVLIDPFQDRRRGILFQLNPVGVQADAAWTEGNGADYSYDQVWDSDGRVTKDGWMALFAIPFRSLRFRPGGGDWGVVLWRSLPRNSETDFWPRVAAGISGTLTQEGTLHGIEGVTGSHNVQLNPYAIGQNEKTLDQRDPLNPYFSDRHLEGTAGGDAKVILKDSIVIDATVNPDFSQVESDQPQFTVNQRYPVYFPELRPFFLENANYFGTPLQLVYTRNIVHPEFGARLTGKVGKTNLGFFAIDDRASGEDVGAGDPLYKKKAIFAVGRVSEDIGKKGSSVGLIYADEEFGGGWNRVGGVDFSARFNDHVSIAGQMVESSTKGNIDAPFYSAGPATDVQFVRSGHSFNLNSEYQDYSSGFQSQVGFIQTANIRTDSTHSTYQWYPKHAKVQNFGIETNQQFAFDHQGRRVYRYSQLDVFAQLPLKTTLAPILISNSDSLGPQDGYALTQSRNFAENQIGFVARSAPSTRMNFNLQAFHGGNVNYNPLPGAPPTLLHQDNAQVQLSVQPLRQLTMDNIYLLDRDFEAQGHQFVYESQTMRTKINYQFTRAFSARVIVEYDSTLANPLTTSLSRTKQIGTEALLTWLPHPGTAIYIGYNNDIQNLNRTFCTRVAGGECDPSQPILGRSANYLNDGKQIFIKASYLLRF